MALRICQIDGEEFPDINKTHNVLLIIREGVGFFLDALASLESVMPVIDDVMGTQFFGSMDFKPSTYKS